jgi:hypothetical protein
MIILSTSVKLRPAEEWTAAQVRPAEEMTSARTALRPAEEMTSARTASLKTGSRAQEPL